MKKAGAFVLAVLLAVTLGASAQIQTEEWTGHVFTFLRPSGWTAGTEVRQDSENSTTWQYSLKSGETKLFAVQEVRDDVSGLSDEYVETLLEAIRLQFGAAEFLTLEKKTENGLRCWVYTLQSGEDTVGGILAVGSGGLLQVFAVTGTEDEVKPLLDEVAASLRENGND